ncbi:MAG: RdgB/HAM1 family non-canonical purine NTP pyrophosphatase [candidate division WOR-3 bacterium]
MRVLISTGNLDKFREIVEIISLPEIEFLSLRDFGSDPPPETGLTLAQNARIKATHGFQVSGLLTLAEDTGLFVDALGGMPGVFSSRFAGPAATYRDNRLKLLEMLEGIPFEKRGACFTTIVCITRDGKDFAFVEGKVRGFITTEERGEGGFGYDPVFLYPQMGRTFAELPRCVKNQVSHRGRAFRSARDMLLKLL